MIRINTQVPVLPVAAVTAHQGNGPSTQDKLNAQAAVTGGAASGYAQEAMTRDVRRDMAERLIAHKQAAQALQQEAQRVIAAMRKNGDSTSGNGGRRNKQHGKDDRQSGAQVPAVDETTLDGLSDLVSFND